MDVLFRDVGQRRSDPFWLICSFWLSVLISIAAVLRRLYALVRPQGGPSPTSGMDATFASHAALTVMHIVPAAIFVLLSAAVLLRRARGASLERLFFIFGVITGATAYAMSYHVIGGALELSAVLVFNTWFLFSLGRAYWFSRRGARAQQRDWMTRAVGILLGIATTRPVMGVFFATSFRTHLGPNQFFGIAFWIGFSLNAIAVELWLHSKRRTSSLGAQGSQVLP